MNSPLSCNFLWKLIGIRQIRCTTPGCNIKSNHTRASPLNSTPFFPRSHRPPKGIKRFKKKISRTSKNNRRLSTISFNRFTLPSSSKLNKRDHYRIMTPGHFKNTIRRTPFNAAFYPPVKKRCFYNNRTPCGLKQSNFRL